MTDAELTAAVRAIWRKACAEVTALVKAQGLMVFDGEYDFHRYVKHGDRSGLVKGGEDLLRLFLEERTGRGTRLITATKENIIEEKAKCRKDAIRDCRRFIAQAKDTIASNEAFLRELLSDKEDIDYDNR